MNLILWRHAEAEDSNPDLERKLTKRGLRQAAYGADWLRRHLPERYALISSPAVRARSTAEALGVPVELDPRILPGADADGYLAACGWPDGVSAQRETVILVGHQPAIGRTASLLLSGSDRDRSFAKGAVWWLVWTGKPGVKAGELRHVVDPPG